MSYSPIICRAGEAYGAGASVADMLALLQVEVNCSAGWFDKT